MDRINRNILSVLQKEGRLSNAELADRVGLSPSACLRRVQILEQSGTIRGYAAVLDDESLGRGTSVIVRISLERQTEDYLDRFEREVRACPDVVECDLMAGASDYQLRVVARDSNDYERIHKEQLSRLTGVARIESNFALRNVVRRPVTLPD